MILNKEEQELFEQSFKDLKNTDTTFKFENEEIDFFLDKNYSINYSNKKFKLYKNKDNKISILEKFKRKRKRFEHHIKNKIFIKMMNILFSLIQFH